MARSSVAVFSLLVFVAPFLVHATSKQNTIPDFDIRYSRREKVSTTAFPLQRAPFAKRKKAERELARLVPAANVKYHAVLGGPEIVGVKGGRHYLTAPASAGRETILRRFLTENSSLYGLTEQQIAELKTTANYENSAGNLSWVKLQQQIHGLPVFRGEMRAAFTSKGELVRTVSELVPDVDNATITTTPLLTAKQAAAIAAQSIGSTAANIFTSELQYFPLRAGLPVLAWAIILKQPDYAYYFFVDAGNGDLLFRKNLMDDVSENATYVVYDGDSPGPLSPSTATPGSGIQGPGVERNTFTLISELPAFDNDGWIPDGANTTAGNNVDAGLDLDQDRVIDLGGRAIGSPYRVFDFNYDPPPLGSDDPTGSDYRFGAVTNVFFWTNRYHDILYQLGFTEADGNFQTDNFGRGGVEGDAVLAFVQRITDNASFFSAPDGAPGEMSLGIFPGPDPDHDGDLDQEVIVHELTHGLSRRLHGNATGLHFLQSRGMGEGWSDFYGRALLSDGSEDVNGLFASAAYAFKDFTDDDGHTLGADNYYYGVRRFPYAVMTNFGPNGKPHSPLTLADIDQSQLDTSDGAFPESPILWSLNGAGEVHNSGEIWCSSLLEVRARLISALGFSTGNQRMLQLTTDAMKLDTANPTFLDGRDSILAADCASYGGADELMIWSGFAARGMGFGAEISSSFFSDIKVVQSFNMPNVEIGEIQYSEPKKSTGVCQNGFPDPGEKLDVVIPYSNPLCADSITQIVANIAGNPGPAKNYGTIAAGATVTRTFNFKVPDNAVCGIPLDVTISAKSNLGTIVNHFPMQIGAPIIVFSENFDAVTPPSLPAGWTTSASLFLLPWITTDAESDSAPNSAFGTEDTGGGGSELISPPISIVNANAQLIFQHHVNIKSISDATLEISIAGGEFEDIESAGGVFVTGPYNNLVGSWADNSGGFFTTTVNLPAFAAGKTVQFRWSITSTSSGLPRPGWFIDDVQVVDGYACCP